MWWKLSILVCITIGLIFCIIPIRTHAVIIDPANPPAPTKLTFSFIVSNFYFTPTTFGMIGIVLGVAIYVGFKIMRSG